MKPDCVRLENAGGGMRPQTRSAKLVVNTIHTGLCRTCEIFGVCELVLPNLTVVEDPQFTALSVSAQHWLKISEVFMYPCCVCVYIGQYMKTTANNQLEQCLLR